MAVKEPEIGTEKETPQKFPLEKLAAGCRTLFGVTSSTFAGATAGMSGDYSIADMKEHITKWLKKEVKA